MIFYWACRVVGKSDKTIAGFKFTSFGQHTDSYPYKVYMTCAAAIGMQKIEVDLFLEKLEKLVKTN